LKRIVILKGSFIDSIEEYVLRQCLRIMFPECNIEIRLDPAANSPDEAIHIKPDQNQFDLLKGKK
jgi:hypothetical protein